MREYRLVSIDSNGKRKVLATGFRNSIIDKFNYLKNWKLSKVRFTVERVPKIFVLACLLAAPFCANGEQLRPNRISRVVHSRKVQVVAAGVAVAVASSVIANHESQGSHPEEKPYHAPTRKGPQ